ncbi:hypothetical protein SE17_08690 [Kouleothrix aurantiaca]|uniref:Uncharacterized protein n=1 Tax=Kouleothrix aurantiaca TaxID=186479 RepID=A0A0P9DU06_9CHLR|nr:hypothetical protein SE17_08690 [Kouleothrix aurantiaca]
MSTSTAVLTPREIDALRGALPSDAIARLCAAIDGAISLDLEARHALQALADRLEDSDTRTAHYLILSGGEIVGCTVGEDGKADADRGNTFEKVLPGTVCPHCEWRVEAQAHRPL